VPHVIKCYIEQSATLPIDMVGPPLESMASTSWVHIAWWSINMARMSHLGQRLCHTPNV